MKEADEKGRVVRKERRKEASKERRDGGMEARVKSKKWLGLKMKKKKRK